MAARADSAYRGIGFATKMSDNEHSTAALGHSEETSVENPPRQAIPEVGQRCENDSHVPSVGRGEEPRDVLNEKPVWSKLICDPGELEEQAGSFTGESASLPGDGQVLARESTCEEVNTPIPIVFFPNGRLTFGSEIGSWIINSSHVVIDEASGEPLRKDPSSPRINLRLGDDSHPRSLKSEVESSDR